MGNCYCSRAKGGEKEYLSAKDDVKGDPPGVNLAVLLDITYWEEPTSTHLSTGAEGDLETTPQSTLDYDDIATSIQSVSPHCLIWVYLVVTISSYAL